MSYYCVMLDRHWVPGGGELPWGGDLDTGKSGLSNFGGGGGGGGKNYRCKKLFFLLLLLFLQCTVWMTGGGGGKMVWEQK